VQFPKPGSITTGGHPGGACTCRPRVVFPAQCDSAAIFRAASSLDALRSILVLGGSLIVSSYVWSCFPSPLRSQIRPIRCEHEQALTRGAMASKFAVSA
jgi:hypothetical protein